MYIYICVYIHVEKLWMCSVNPVGDIFNPPARKQKNPKSREDGDVISGWRPPPPPPLHLHPPGFQSVKSSLQTSLRRRSSVSLHDPPGFFPPATPLIFISRPPERNESVGGSEGWERERENSRDRSTHISSSVSDLVVEKKSGFPFWGRKNRNPSVRRFQRDHDGVHDLHVSSRRRRLGGSRRRKVPFSSWCVVLFRIFR